MRRRRIALVASVTTLALLFGFPGSAVAAPLPNIVDDVPALPSSVVKMSQGTDGAWVMRTLNAMAAANRSTALAPIPKPVPMPITPPTPLVRGAAGGPLTGAFMAGWTITDGVLMMYGQQTGDNPLQGSCGWGEVGQAVVTVLYPLSKPNCAVQVLEPNKDAPAGWSAATWNGGSIRYLETRIVGTGYGSKRACYAYTPPLSNTVGSIRGAIGVKLNNGTYGQLFPDTTTGTFCDIRPFEHYNALLVSTVGYFYNTSTGQSIGTLPAETSGNPNRGLNCTIKWRDGTTTTGSGGSFKESDGIPLGGVQAGCQQAFVSKPGAGPDLLPSEIKVGSINTDTGAQTEISTQPVPDFDATQKQALSPGANGGLRLLKIAGLDAGSCMTWAADCSNWWTQSEAGTKTDTYGCVFAGQPVSLSECGVYRETFDTKTNTPTITDPVTGQQNEWSSAPDPANSPGTGGQAGQSPTQCVETFTLNPVDWVMRPLRCLFEPSQAKVDAFRARIDATWRGTWPAQLSTVFAGLGAAFGTVGAGSCAGLVVNVPTVGPDWKPVLVQGRYLPACPGDTFADVAPAFFWIISGGIVIIGALGIKQRLDKLVNA